MECSILKLYISVPPPNILTQTYRPSCTMENRSISQSATELQSAYLGAGNHWLLISGTSVAKSNITTEALRGRWEFNSGLASYLSTSYWPLCSQVKRRTIRTVSVTMLWSVLADERGEMGRNWLTGCVGEEGRAASTISQHTTSLTLFVCHGWNTPHLWDFASDTIYANHHS